LLERTETLNFQLDQNLLWLPSTAAVGLTWPLQVLEGVFQTFNFTHIELLAQTLFKSAQDNFILVLILLVLMFTCYMLRAPLWDKIYHGVLGIKISLYLMRTSNYKNLSGNLSTNN